MHGTSTRVFVYGTLMRGARNERLMAAARLVDAAAVTGEARFRMLQFDSASSPGRQTPGVRADGAGRILSEVYEVDDAGLEVLDRLEQNGVRYRREQVPMQDGGLAWIYLLIAGDTPSTVQDRIRFDPASRVFSWQREEPGVAAAESGASGPRMRLCP